jgi:hypothetical protein
MANFNPEEYETVDSRIKRFYSDHEDGKIVADLISSPDNIETVVVKAYIFLGERLVATGLAFEQAGQGFVNKTSHLENCETSAIGRALANYNYSGDKRPSREEMDKTQGKPTETAKPKSDLSDIEQLFQTIIAYVKAHPDQFGGNIGPKMNEALDLRTKGDADGLAKMKEEIGA